MLREYPIPSELIPGPLSEDGIKQNVGIQKKRDAAFAFQEKLHERVLAALPKIENTVDKYAPGSAGAPAGIDRLRELVQAYRTGGDTSFKPQTSAPKDTLDSKEDMSRGLGIPMPDDSFRDMVRKAYENGSLDHYIGDMAAAPEPVKPAATAPTSVAGADNSGDHGFHANAAPFAPAVKPATAVAAVPPTPPKSATASATSPAVPSDPKYDPRTAPQAYRPGTKRHLRGRMLAGEQARIQHQIDTAAKGLSDALKDTNLDLKDKAPKQWMQILAADGGTRAAYMMHLVDQGKKDTKLADLADPAKLKAILQDPKNVELAKQFDIIAKNAKQLGPDGKADVEKIAKSFAHRQKIAKAHGLANTLPDGSHATMVAHVIQIAVARTDQHLADPTPIVATAAAAAAKPKQQAAVTPTETKPKATATRLPFFASGAPGA